MVEDVDCSKDVKKEVTNLKPWLKDCASRSLTETGKSQKSLVKLPNLRKRSTWWLYFTLNFGKTLAKIMATSKSSALIRQAFNVNSEISSSIFNVVVERELKTDHIIQEVLLCPSNVLLGPRGLWRFSQVALMQNYWGIG